MGFILRQGWPALDFGEEREMARLEKEIANLASEAERLGREIEELRGRSAPG